MRKLNQIFIIILLLLTQVGIVQADEPEGPDGIKRFTVSGSIMDKNTGEELLGATVFVKEISTGTATNLYGFYSISLPEGKYNFVYSYIGYKSVEKLIMLDSNITMNIELAPAQEMLDEVVITSERLGQNLIAPEMSSFKMDARTIKSIPAFMGEVDVIKAIQLLPGVQAASEGSSGFSVRGGSPDQNLILLDEATVYNASHLMGFFSVFNNDAVKDVKLYKGDIPAAYGGRLSSLLDVRMKEGNLKDFSMTGGIGTISSRLTLEAPIIKDKMSFVLAGRRTYADVFLFLAKDTNLRESKLYFYDLNGKVNYKINENNRIFLSSYMGKDIFGGDDFKMGWGNQTVTLRWNHLFSKKLFSNFTAIYNKFDYELGVPEGDVSSFEWQSQLYDYSLKADFGYYLTPENTIRFGISSIYHRFHPGSARGLGEEAFFTEFTVPQNNAIESGIYISNEQKIGSKVNLSYGLRFSLFNNIGAGTVYNLDENHNPIDSTVYPRGDIYNTYFGLEPRVTASYSINEVSSVKASYARNRQYIHLASNSTAGTPLDVWFPSSPNVKPQIADQVAAGYFRNFKENIIETSVEVYYKYTQNAIDFKDHAELLLNPEFEGELRFGTAQSYGLEFLVKKVQGKLTGWVGYTLSKSERTIKEINNGEPYVSPYDKTNDLSIVVSYALNDQLTFGATWVYATGSPVTFPTGGAWYQGARLPIYSDRNAYRLPDYHRMDISITYRGKYKPERRWRGELNLSVYNLYNRKNTWVINFEQEPDNPSQLYAEKTYLFGILPALTYNFKF